MSAFHSYHSLIYGSAQQITGVGTASATQSTSFPAATTGIRIVADGAIWFRVNGSASPTTGAYLPANIIEFAPADSSAIVSVIAATTNSRTVWITPFGG